MKIIHLILGKANPERMNGVNKVVHALATQQSRAGWDVAVWGITADVAPNFPPREFRTRLFLAQRNPFGLAPALREALAELRGAAVVHLHGGFVPAYYAAVRRLTALGIPYVMTPHGSYGAEAMRKNRLGKRLYLHLCENYLLRHAAQVHCLGLSEVLGVQRLHPGLRTCLLPYGFELPETDAAPALVAASAVIEAEERQQIRLAGPPHDAGSAQRAAPSISRSSLAAEDTTPNLVFEPIVFPDQEEDETSAYARMQPAVRVLRRAESGPARSFRVGFCGRLDENHKGLSCLIRGFGEFARQHPQAELWLIGDGPDRARVEQWAAEVPAGTVKVLGSRFGAEKTALLRQLDVFAHTSHYEGLPTAVLEAAALGLPCVVTEATNLGSYVRQFDCGEVLPTAEPAAFSGGLQRVYARWRSAAGQQLRQRSRQMVATAFAWPTLLQQYQHMYEQAYDA